MINLSAWDEYDDDAMGGVDFTIDMLNPFTMPSVYKFYRDPNSLTAVQMAYWPTVTTAGAYLASAIAGSGNPYHWTMYRYLVAEKFKLAAQQARAMSPTIGRVISHPAVLAPVFIGAVSYQYAGTAEELGGLPSPHSSGMGLAPRTESGGSSTNIFPGMEFSDFLPWNW